jgi:hypothetical protein
MDVVSLVVALLGIVAAVAPGVLAAITGKPTDEAAIAAASASVRAIRRSPAASAIDRERIRGGERTADDEPADGNGGPQ